MKISMTLKKERKNTLASVRGKGEALVDFQQK